MHNIKNIVYVLVFFISIFIFNPLVHAYTTYSVGDEVEYNGIKFYVISDSGANEESVTLLKAEPLTVDEVNRYGGVGTENNHVNMYVTSNTNAEYYQTAYNENGYGGMAYYSNQNCHENYSALWYPPVNTECTTDYKKSDIKYVVDAWALDKISSGLSEARLLTLDDLIDNLGLEFSQVNPSTLKLVQSENIPMWIFTDDYRYWTSSANNDEINEVFFVRSKYNQICSYGVYGSEQSLYTVRPVIILKKLSIVNKDADTSNINDEIVVETKKVVNVPNTMQKVSIILIMIGVILVSISIVIVIKIRN